MQTIFNYRREMANSPLLKLEEAPALSHTTSLSLHHADCHGFGRQTQQMEPTFVLYKAI